MVNQGLGRLDGSGQRSVPVSSNSQTHEPARVVVRLALGAPVAALAPVVAPWAVSVFLNATRVMADGHEPEF